MNIVTVANFKPQKNMIDVAHVAEVLVPNLPHANFTCMGDGPERKEVEGYVEKIGLKDHFNFMGWVKGEEKVKDILKMGSFDVFLLTSLWEGLPRALLQAALAGIPCVCYAIDGVKDILIAGETGFPIPPGDFRRAAAAIHWIKKNQLASIWMAKNLRKKVILEFSIEKMVKDQEDLYASLAKQKGLWR